MKIFREWTTATALRIRALVQRRRLERELEMELAFHLAMREQAHRLDGLSQDDAGAAARRQFGNVGYLKEDCRELWTFATVETFWQDLRYAARMLGRNATMTLAAVLSLAIGIGGSAAVFSVINGVLIRRLPYARPERLVRISDAYPKGAIAAFARQSKTMDVAGFTTDSEFNLAGQGETVHLAGSSVSAGLFTLLGVEAELGRTFRKGDDQFGRNSLVLLSHSLWKDKFHGDPAAIGRMVTIDGRSRRIVGVMPADFAFPSFGARIWIPFDFDPANWVDSWAAGFMPMIARLRPQATIEQARSELHPLISRIIPLFPYDMARNWNADADVVPLKQAMAGDSRRELLVLLGAVGIVLLIACVNVASLLLSVAAKRGKEIALRAALGAPRVRIVRQLLTEAVLLAVVGGGFGVALAFGILAVLKLVLPMNTPRLAEVGIDGSVLLFSAALALLAGLASGLAPALTAARTDLAAAMKAAGRRVRGTGTRMRNLLISVEVALSVTLVVSAGLLIKSLWLLTQVNPGFRTEQILTLRVYPSQSSCEQRTPCIDFYQELLQRARGVTGVSDVAAANSLPLSGAVPSIPAELEGHPIRPTEKVAPLFWAGAITPDYLHIMRIPLLQGRAFTEADDAGSEGVVLVSAATARRFWPGQNPIGKHVRPIWDQPWRTVVGVVADVHQYKLAADTPGWVEGALYMPYPQSVGTNRQLPAAMALLVRTAADPAVVAGGIRRVVASMNPNVPVSEIRPMEAVVSASTSQPRSLMWLFIGFAASALLLAAIGTYGVISFAVAQRTYEIGMRLALGAPRRSVFGMVLGQSLQWALSGLAVGAVASLALTRMLAAFLYRVAPTDPMTLLVVGLVVIALALAASYLPARRAAALNATTALRVD